MPTSYKKVNTNTIVQIDLCDIAGTSACLRSMMKSLAQFRKIVPAKMHVIRLQTLSRAPSPHLYHQPATAHLETRVTGTATAWKRSTPVKTPPTRTRLDTLRSFADCMKNDIRYSVQMEGNGWMLFENVFRFLWSHYCVLGTSQHAKKYERKRLLLTLLAI